MSTSRRICGSLAIALCACTALFYLYVVLEGSESPTHTLIIFCLLIAGFGGAAVLAIIGKRAKLAWVSGVFGIFSFPLLLLYAAVLEAMGL